MFGFLEDVAQAFVKYLEDQHGKNWSSEVARVARPYPYIHFGAFHDAKYMGRRVIAGTRTSGLFSLALPPDAVIRQRRRQALDPERKAGASRLQERMSEIHGVMSRNISDILDRGEKLDGACALYFFCV